MVTSNRAKLDREHDRAERNRERRAPVYLELETALHRLQMRIERTAPLLDYGEPLPDPLTDEESWRINALTDTYATSAVRGLIGEWNRKQLEYFIGAEMLPKIREYAAADHSDEDTRSAYGATEVDQLRKLHALREELRSLVKATGEQVRRELG